jgi:hypothetical protein
MSSYLQVLESPLTRDRIALIPQDKKAIALSILKLRKNPSDTRSKSVIREQINATGDRTERRELEKILSFAECPVYSDTQKGHLEMAQNIGLHWANKIIAKHSDSIVNSFADDFDWDVRTMKEEIKDEFVDRLNNYYEDDGGADLVETGKAITDKIGKLDDLIGPIKYDDWTDTTPADTRLQESANGRFYDYVDENFALIGQEIQARQSQKRNEIIKTAKPQLDKLAKNTVSEAVDKLLLGKLRDTYNSINELATNNDYRDLTDDNITESVLEHLEGYINGVSGEGKLGSQLQAIENKLDEHLGDTDSFEIFSNNVTEHLKTAIAEKMGDIRKEIYARYLPRKRQENRENVGIDNTRLKNKNKLKVEVFVENPKEIPGILQRSGKWKKNKAGYYESTIDTTGNPLLHRAAQKLGRKGVLEVKNWEQEISNFKPDTTYLKKVNQSLKDFGGYYDREQQREKRIPLVNYDPSKGIAKGHDYKSYTEEDKLKFRSNWMDNSDFNTDKEGDDDNEKWIQFADKHGWDAEDIDVKLGWA